MASRAQKYGTTYVPAYRMALRWEQIQAEIKAEGERAQAAAEEAARERAALADLDARFAAEGVSPDVLAGYLAAVGAERQASTAAGSAARAAQAKADTAAQRILDAPRVTQELVDGLVSGGRAPSPALAAALQAKLAATPTAATAVAGLRPGGSGARGPSGAVVEQREIIRLTAPEAAYSPAAQPLVDQRAVTPVAVKGAESLSEAQLLGAYTTALQGGTGGDLAGRFQAALGAIAPAGAEPQALLAAADQLYTRVRQEGSFSRQDRKYFEPTWLAAADAARAATEEAEALKPGYTDPAREAARREIIARGLNPDDKYVGLIGDRRYDYLTAADRIYGEVDGAVKPATPEQTKIAEFVSYLKREADRTGKPVELKTLERELGKTLKGKALVEGVGFALALAKSESERPEDRKTQADLQREAELTAQRLKEIEATKAAAELERNRIESDLQAEIENLTRQAAATAAEQGRLSQVESVPVRRVQSMEELDAGIRRGIRRENRFGLDPRSRYTGEAFVPPTALRSRESLEAELFPEAPGPRTVTLRSGPGRDVPPPAGPFDPLQVPSLDQRATQTVLQSLRSGGDLRTNALRLRALGWSNEQIRALVAAARSQTEPPKPTAKTFIDWSDPKRPTYTRNPDGTITGPDGKPITAPRAVEALTVVEAGDTPENRAALEKIQAQARNPAGTGKSGKPASSTPSSAGGASIPSLAGYINTEGAAPPPRPIGDMTDEELRALIGE